jgi:hypothetical protein
MRRESGAAELHSEQLLSWHCGERLVVSLSPRRRQFDPRPICDGQSAIGTDLFLSTSGCPIRFIPSVLRINLAIDTLVQ